MQFIYLRFYKRTELNFANRNRVKLLSFSILAIIFCVHSITAQSLPKYKLNDIVVTASRIPTTFSDLTRSVTIIDQQQIAQAPVNSVQGLFQYALGVDLQQRGVDGVQADIGIRGGTFEETLILIDGMKVNDPQTGHHNLNLPLSLDDIKRIEILKGQGSSVYGPNAFSGVINVITKKGTGKNLSIQAEGGQNSYYKGEFYGSYPVGNIGNRISFSKEKSDGYRFNTGFDVTNFTYGSSYKLGHNDVSLFYGYNDKKFGANGYYAAAYPDQWEHTTTRLLNAAANIGGKSFRVSPKIYWRRNDDNYLLDYIHPNYYQNIHQTNIYGAQVQVSLTNNFGTTSFGGKYTTDKIKSTNLGNHLRENKGIFAEEKLLPVENLTVIAGAFAYNYATIGWRFWPSVSLEYNISKSIRLFGSAGKAFRVPTYTELYYSSPTSIGNPNLQHEETINYEAGINYAGNIFYSRLSLFRKEGKNLIDWVRTSNNQPWTAKNISSINTDGIEFNFTIYPYLILKHSPIIKVNIDYTYLTSNKETAEFQSQYLLNYLRHQLIIGVSNNWWFGIRQSWSLRYENRVNFENNFLVDTQLMKKIQNFEIFLKATNLFNKTYHEISGVPLPGRWITAGVKFNLGE